MTDTRLTVGGVFTPTLALISTDQETILGDGTPANPIRLSSSSGGGTLLVGTLFEASEDVGSVVGISPSGNTFRRSSAAGDPLTVANAQAIGIASGFNADTGEVTVTTSGEVTLTTGQWDQATGGSGGLSSGTIYYVGLIAGTLLTTPPAVAGQFVAQVGIARTSTIMIMSTPSFPLLVVP